MKFFDKLVLKIFSLIMFALTLLIILIMTNVITIDTINTVVIKLTDYENGLKILIACLAVIMLLSIKGLFFTSKSNNKNSKEGIILENNSGKLIISKESLENLIYGVVKDVPGAESVTSRTILDKDKNLIVYVTVSVSKNVMLKDITRELQNKVKSAMKRTADLDVKEVNIKIKNITQKKVKCLPAPSSNDKENDDNFQEENISSEEKNEGDFETDNEEIENKD